jgi:hydroxymethylpyrimidine/phosphomethylpyrimidine kinase
MKTALTIAGSDSSGGAGIQADLKTFSAHGLFGMSVIVAVTAQNTQKVVAVQDITPDMIKKQIDAIFQDIDVDVVKIGMVSQVESILAIAERLELYKPELIVLDTVMVSKSGYDLLNPESVDTLIEKLLPLATLVTPNIPEAEKLTGQKITSIEDMEEAAKSIYKIGAKNILITGGHLEGDAIDVLFDGDGFTHYKSPKIQTKNTHGTGCTLSSAIASNLALGMDIRKAVSEAKSYIDDVIIHSLEIGKGAGPTNHFYRLYRDAKIFK